MPRVFSHAEYAEDMVYVYGFCNGNATTSVAEYQRRFPQRMFTAPDTQEESIRLIKDLAITLVSHIIIDRKLIKNISFHEMFFIGIPVRILDTNNINVLTLGKSVVKALELINTNQLQSLKITVLTKGDRKVIEEYCIIFKYNSDNCQAFSPDEPGIFLTEGRRIKFYIGQTLYGANGLMNLLGYDIDPDNIEIMVSLVSNGDIVILNPLPDNGASPEELRYCCLSLPDKVQTNTTNFHSLTLLARRRCSKCKLQNPATNMKRQNEEKYEGPSDKKKR